MVLIVTVYGGSACREVVMLAVLYREFSKSLLNSFVDALFNAYLLY